MQTHQVVLPGHPWANQPRVHVIVRAASRLLNIQSPKGVALAALLWFAIFAAPSLYVFGFEAWPARLCSVAGAALTITVLFRFLKTHVNPRLAALSAYILFTQPLLLLFGVSHYGSIDLVATSLFTLTVISGATAVLRYEQHDRYGAALALMYTLAAVGFLANGLIGVGLPVGILLLWLLARRRYDSVFRMVWLPGIALFLLITLPWMWQVQPRYSGLFTQYIDYLQFDRLMVSMATVARPIWLTVPVLLLLTLPWSIQLWRLASKAWWKNTPYGAVHGLMAIWLVATLVFSFSPVSGSIAYVLQALPPLAFFIAETFERRLQGSGALRVLKTFAWSIGASLLLCVSAIGYVLVHST